MPPAERADLPLAFQVLREDLDEILGAFPALEQANTEGERGARWDDVARAVESYLCLENEAVFPALKRHGCEHAAAAAGHEKVRAALAAVRGEGASAAAIHTLQDALRSHLREQERETWPRAARALAPELAALAVEWNARRNRLDGHYGV